MKWQCRWFTGTWCWHFPAKFTVQRGAKVWIMNTDLLGSLDALLPTGRLCPRSPALQIVHWFQCLTLTLPQYCLHILTANTAQQLILVSYRDGKMIIMLIYCDYWTFKLALSQLRQLLWPLILEETHNNNNNNGLLPFSQYHIPRW